MEGQEEPGRARKSQGEPGRARKGQRRARVGQEEPG